MVYGEVDDTVMRIGVGVGIGIFMETRWIGIVVG